jgi:GT2 family glycosyltransferase
MTHNALKGARDHAGMKTGRILTIEQNRKSPPQTIGETLYYDFEFNYNRCLNMGIALTNSRYIALCNNDLYFERNWAKNAVKAMQAGGYLSACPSGRHIFRGVIEGYKVGVHILGWCIIVDRAIFDKIGKLSEVVNFWFSDDVYAVQLRCAGIKHILVGNSKVKHFRSRTLFKVPEDRTDKTTGQRKIFEQYKKQMYADSGIEIEVKEGRHNRRKRRV